MYDVYDVFILGLMIVGITSLVVFSYKIFHSRVYPVGIVRRVPAAQEYVDKTSTGLTGFKSLQTELMSLLDKGWSNSEIARDLHLSEQDIKDYLQRATWEVYSKRRLSPQSGKRQYMLALHNLEHPLHECEHSALEEEVIGHGEALKLHSRLEDFEKRIRRLEVESVQKLQEAAEEKPQPPQAVH
ncbi:MAG TPA: hypothetical protein VN966_05595 [Candidatus Bathyarchaeia archaeon]|nr:hypothetical protein [Candidatus Bathyarchaeia archaeon]